MFTHLVARATRGSKPFADPATAWWLMWRLRLDFPLSLGACVMPEHTHLLTETPEPERARTRLTRILSRLIVRLGVPHLFEPVPEPEVVANGQHLERLLRYIWLNPCRAKLVADPLAWPWSTYRGVLGAEVDPWVSADRVATALGRPTRGFASAVHAYVSGDPSVEVRGSPVPALCLPRETPSIPLESVRSAALAATPWSPSWLRRREIVELAAHQGWRDVGALARASGLGGRSVQRILAGELGPDRAACLCLGDERLALEPGRIRPLALCPRRWVPPLFPQEHGVAFGELV